MSDTIAAVFRLTAGKRTPHFIELTFDGFDADPRAVFEIPEIVAWCKFVHEQFPETPQWLTPGSMARFFMCVVAGFYGPTADGALEMNTAAPGVMEVYKSSLKAAVDHFASDPSTNDASLCETFVQAVLKNFGDALRGHIGFGKDYVVAMA